MYVCIFLITRRRGVLRYGTIPSYTILRDEREGDFVRKNGSQDPVKRAESATEDYSYEQLVL